MHCYLHPCKLLDLNSRFGSLVQIVSPPMLLAADCILNCDFFCRISIVAVYMSVGRMSPGIVCMACKLNISLGVYFFGIGLCLSIDRTDPFRCFLFCLHWLGW